MCSWLRVQEELEIVFMAVCSGAPRDCVHCCVFRRNWRLCSWLCAQEELEIVFLVVCSKRTRDCVHGCVFKRN